VPGHYGIGNLLFIIQFLIAIYLFVVEIRSSCLILSQAICPANLNLMVFNYVKILLLVPIIGLSFLFSAFKVIAGWKFDVVQEMIGVFIFIAWALLLIGGLFLNLTF